MGMLLLNGSSDLNPRELFASGEQGLWLDPSDMTAGKAAWRRNLLTRTEEFDNAFWPKSDTTVTANATTAPDGTTTADKLIAAATTANHLLNLASVIPVTSGVTYTHSVYAKKGEYNFIRLQFQANGFLSTAWANFNLDTGSAASNGGGVTASIQSIGNGWYRCAISATASSTASSGCQPFVIDSDRTGTSPSYLGDGTSGIFIWGAQLELGSTPTEYQPITDFSTEFKAAFPTHTLYQDSNGVTPCTAAGDPVGLILDQSRGGLGALGAELVTNGDFASGQTGWIDSPVAPSGWSFTGGALVGSNAAGGYEQAVQVTSGKWYRCTITLSNLSGGAVSFAIAGAGAGPIFSSNGTNTVLINAGSTGNIGIVRRTSNFTGSIDNISIREVPGNHAYQTTSASRPTLARIPSSGRRNILTYSEQFDVTTGGWTKVNATVSANTTTAPDGTTTADTLIDDATNADHKVRQGVAITSGTTYTVSVYAKANTLNFVWIYAGTPNVGRVFNLATGATGGTVGNAPTSSAISAIGNGWYRCSITYTAGATSTQNHDIGTSPDGTSINYIGTGQSAFLWGAQLETGSTATNYQKVGSTTDVTESGVGDLWHLVFDGSDDSLTTAASVDFSGTDEMTVIAGVRKLSDAAYGCLIESSADINSNAGTFNIFAGGRAAAGPEMIHTARGTASNASSLQAQTAAFASPVTLVVTGQSDISEDVSSMRVNGIASGTSATGDKGSGNFGNYAIYIGRRGGSSLPFNGHLYQLIIRGKTTPTNKLLEAERFTAKKTGVSF